jgi:transmembrane sensor
MDNAVFIGLIDRYIEGKATDAERRWVETYYRHLEQEEYVRLRPEQEEALGRLLSENILRRISEEEAAEKTMAAPEDNIYRLKRSFGYPWHWAAAAAALIFLLVGGDYLVNRWEGAKQAGTVPGKQEQADVQPGGNKAMLTLADGSTITLDSVQNGTLATQGSARVLKLQNGQLAYNTIKQEKGAVQPATVSYNTIRTPRGGQYEVVLPDGSKVWLDAASSLHFPTAFNQERRDVELSGQAYFEIAEDKAAPFHVKVGGTDVEVLGTHFNVNAYPEEGAVRTTLLEGAVKMSVGGSSRVLTPGQQASWSDGQAGAIQIRSDVDVEAEIAWKNGLFQFRDAGLKEVMRQLNRWYDVDVVYEGVIPSQQFDGKMQRTLTLSQVLRILEKSQVHFTIEGKKIIVQP